MEQYKDPIIKEMEKRAKEVGGHGGNGFHYGFTAYLLSS